MLTISFAIGLTKAEFYSSYYLFKTDENDTRSNCNKGGSQTA